MELSTKKKIPLLSQTTIIINHLKIFNHFKVPNQMEASSSTSSSLRRRAPFRCCCAKKPVLVVSWTPDNPGRRFYGCPNYWVGRKCKFFQWRDDEICERGKVRIPEQRQWIIKLEAEVARCYKREKFYIVALAFLLVICGICLFNCMGS